MFLAVDAANLLRRIAFGDREHAERYAAQLDPPWRVVQADDPEVPPLTGRPAAD
ncbi:MAG TPA: hypothetical protein VIC62_21110 [Nakamurella sp.]|jgi:hypothetical protein